MAHFGGRTHCGRWRIAPEPDYREAPAARPTHEEIARLAYSYWEARGGTGGSSLADWLRAEDELRRRGATVRLSAPPAP